MPSASKPTHAAVLGPIALTAVPPTTPACCRVVCVGQGAEDFQRIGSRFVTSATVPLRWSLYCAHCPDHRA
jgi:hypothetical protein